MIFFTFRDSLRDSSDFLPQASFFSGLPLQFRFTSDGARTFLRKNNIEMNTEEWLGVVGLSHLFLRRCSAVSLYLRSSSAFFILHCLVSRSSVYSVCSPPLLSLSPFFRASFSECSHLSLPLRMSVFLTDHARIPWGSYYATINQFLSIFSHVPHTP